MKAPQIMRLLYTLAAASIPLTLFALSQGPDARHTGAPGDIAFSCASAGCHTNSKGGGPVNFHGGGVSATFSGGSVYTPGTPVNITVRVGDPTNRQFGFQMSARLESNLAQAQAGRFVYPAASGIGVICDNDAPRSPTGNCPAARPVEFIEHTAVSNSGTWSFSWTPPATASGPVHFYLAGNAVNGDLSSDGNDHVYNTEYVLTPATPCVTGAPVVTAVISAGSFGARTDFAPGSWLEIYGSNFAGGTKLWQGPDFNGATAPTVLDGVRAKVNGKDAFTWVVTPGQLNVQAPDNAGTGPMSVTVSNCEQTSAPVSLTQQRSAPGMWAPPSFTSSGRQLLGATTADGRTFIGTIAGLQSRPAKPGEMVIAYGVGFGATNPAVAPGQITPGLAPLADTFAFTIGGVPITGSNLVYAGLAPGFVGLYQFNVIVPDVPDGDQPVTVRVGTSTVPQTLFLSVKR